MKVKKSYGNYIALLVTFVLFAIIMPIFIKGEYMVTVLCNGVIYAIAVYGLNVMLGMGGQVTFATAGMMGVGAFAYGALTTKAGVHETLAIFLAIAMTAAFSALVGYALLKLKGNYFAFASIALTQVLYVVMQNWKPVTGGADGINHIPPINFLFWRGDQNNKMTFFYVLCILALLCALVVERIRKSSLGRSLASIRDNEIAANCLGVNIFVTRIIAFTIAGAFAALAGVLLAGVNSYISAESFNFDQSGIYLVMAMLGGIQSTIGSFLGAVILTLLPEAMRSLQSYYKLVYGLLVIFIMIFMPMGFAGVIESIIYNIKHPKKKGERKIKEVAE